MFCASRDTRVSYGWCLPIQGYFWAVKNYVEKAEISKCSWYIQKENWGEPRIFRDNMPYIVLYLGAFSNIVFGFQ